MADRSLVDFLRGFYSIGQLQIIYCTLTDKGNIPDMSQRDREERAEAIRQILGEAAPQPEPVPVETPTSQPQTPKMELAKAQRLAMGLVTLLEDYCDRIHIAGSIRRQKADVKDIEIVCQPKTYGVGGGGLFDIITHYEPVPAFRRAVESLGKPIKGKPDGRYMQIDLPSGIKLDLFMPTATDYFRQLAIRTGSADYSAQRIATSWKAKGWCGTSDGLRLINECEETKSGWKCVRRTPTLPPAWKSEEEFFAWIGVSWLEPRLRTI